MLIENFVSRKTVKEKLNDRRIAEPSMDENSKKIRELTEAMRAEWDVQDPQQDDGGAQSACGIPHAAGRLRIRAGVEQLSTIRTE